MTARRIFEKWKSEGKEAEHDSLRRFKVRGKEKKREDPCNQNKAKDSRERSCRSAPKDGREGQGSQRVFIVEHQNLGKRESEGKKDQEEWEPLFHLLGGETVWVEKAGKFR